MEMERPKTSGRPPSERPVHHWRREDDDPNRPISTSDRSQTGRPQTSAGRPQTRIERPVSRRGVQNEPQRDASAYRAPTPARTGRPPSASAYSHRGSTANARLNTMASAMGMSRVNTGLPPTSHVSSGMMERPITQQGIAGVRPGTTRGLTRQIQDKRYYDGLVQLKVRELTQEITLITREIEAQAKERATFIHYDNRAKELAAELTELQGKLADYNIVVDKVTSNVDREAMEQEAEELRALNDKASEEIERLFEQRRYKEQQLRDMEEKIESEQKKEERIVEAMSPDVRQKYDQLAEMRNELENEITRMQKEIDLLSIEKSNLEEQIALSQVKQEAVKLRVKITEVEEKKARLQEEQRNKLSPEQEREKLLAKVKQDNMDIVAAERRIGDAKKQISQVEQEMEQLEMDMEDNQSEKQSKFNELRKREEAIEQFMPTFEQNKAEEVEKIVHLEENIVEKLKRLAFAIDSESGQLGMDEMSILNVISNEDGDDHSFEGLSREHARLQQALTKMESLEKKLKAELAELSEKVNSRESELIVLEDLDGLKARSEMEHEELTAKREELKRRQPTIERELESVRREYNGLKQELERNEIYVQISALEEKYEKLREGNENLKKFIEEGKERVNYIPLREKALSLVKKYNEFLLDNTRSVY